MTSSKHPTQSPSSSDELGRDVPPLPDDLEQNPGIGASKGMSGADPDEVAADNTVEGDVVSDGAAGSIPVTSGGPISSRSRRRDRAGSARVVAVPATAHDRPIVHAPHPIRKRPGDGRTPRCHGSPPY